MLDLVRLSPRRIFPPGGRDLYRQVAILTDLSPGDEVLDVACGKGVPLEFFVREFGAHGTGVDVEPYLIQAAEEHARDEDLASALSFQKASPADLPFRDRSFDVVIGELGLTYGVDPTRAIEELVRVTRPGGQLVLIQLVWKAPVEADRRRILSEHLGARPFMAVELRRILKAAGIGDLHTEDWTDEETAFRPRIRKPFPDFAELFTLMEKLGILRRAWRRWGWRGVRTVFQREAEVHRLLTRERVLGLNLLKGTKPEAPEEEGHGASRPEEAPGDGEGKTKEEMQVSGLPLFGESDENGGS